MNNNSNKSMGAASSKESKLSEEAELVDMGLKDPLTPDLHESDSSSSSIATDAVPYSPETQPVTQPAMAGAVASSCSSVQPTVSSENMDIVKAVSKAVSEALHKENRIDGKNVENSDIDMRIQKYINMGYMSFELKFGYKDAMILCCEKDDSAVKEFRDSLQRDILLNAQEKPKIEIFSEIANSLGSQMRSLEFALERCTFVFLYISPSFVTDAWSEYSSETCLMEAIHNPRRKWSVVPIFTEDRHAASFKIPISINTLKGLRYSVNDEFYKDSVQKLLEDRINVRKLNEMEHKKIQRQWVYDFENTARLEELKKRNEAKKEEQKQNAFRMQLAKMEYSSETCTNPIPVQSSEDNKACNLPDKDAEQESSKKATAHAENLEASISAMEAVSLSQTVNVPLNPNDTESRISSLNDNRDLSSSVDPDIYNQSLVTVGSDKDIEIDIPNSGAASDPSNKNTERVIEVHHHHHHYDPPVYHVTAKNVQIGEGNKMLTRQPKNNLEEELSEEEIEDNGEADVNGNISDDNAKQSNFSVLEEYGITTRVIDDASETAVKEIDASSNNT